MSLNDAAQLLLTSWDLSVDVCPLCVLNNALRLSSDSEWWGSGSPLTELHVGSEKGKKIKY